MRRIEMLMVMICLSFCCYADDMRLGKYVFNSNMAFATNISEYAANLSYAPLSGYVLQFYGDTEVEGKNNCDVIYCLKDLKVVLPAGVDVVLTHRGNNYGGAIYACGDLLIEGPGSVLASGYVQSGGGIKISGAPSLNITSEKGGCLLATDDIVVTGALLTCLGYATEVVRAGNDIKVKASMLNLINGIKSIDGTNYEGGAALSAARDIDLLASVLTINSCGCGIDALGNVTLKYVASSIVTFDRCFMNYGYGTFLFSHVNLNAVSKRHSVVSCGHDQWYSYCSRPSYYMFPTSLGNMNYDSTYGRILLGEGNYMLGSPAEKAAIWCYGQVKVSGADIQCCVPDGNVVFTGDFVMNDGTLLPVETVDFSSNVKTIMGEAVVQALLADSGTWGVWTGTHAAFLSLMVSQFIDILVQTDEGWPKAIVHSRKFTQSDGEIVQGCADYGWFSDVDAVRSIYGDPGNDVSKYVDEIPALVGGVFNGRFWGHGEYRTGSDNVEFYRYVFPTNALGYQLSHVPYSPYWEYRGTPSNADLIPYTKTGWSGPLVLAKSATDYVGTSNFSVDDEVYFHFAVLNRGADLASPFNVSLYLDGTHVVSVKCDALKNNYFSYWTGGKMGAVDPGTHTLSMVVDASNAVLETDEDNNVHTIEFKVIDDRVKIVLDSQGGLVLADQMLIKRGNAVGALPTPTRAKYKFDGWYTAPTGGTKVTASTKVTADVTYYAHWTYDGKVAVSVALGDGCDGMGMVSGGGTVAPGKSVTVKATARSAKKATKTVAAQTATVFAGWYLDAACTVKATGSWQSPTYAYVAGEDDIKLYAKFIEQAVDVAAVSFEMPDELTTGVTAVNTTVDVSGCSSLPTVKVTGLPTGLKFAAKDILKKGSKTEVEYAANTIYGTPTKSGVYAIVVAVTTAGMKTASYSQTVVVRKADEKVVKTNVALVDANGVLVSADVVPGKASGSGVYAVDKKVTLKATVNKGYVFMGWRIGGVIVDKNASYGFSMPDADRDVTALFITAAEDKANIFAGVGGLSLDPWVSNQETHAYKTNVWAGVYLEWPVAVRALSATSVKVSGLPSGLKFASKDVVDVKRKRVTVPANTIYGAPCAVSKQGKASAIKITVTTAGKSTSTFEIDATVLSLPAWAQGTYAGGWASDGDVTSGGQVTLTSSAAGKISGKALGDGVTYTLAAPYYSEVLYLSGGDDSVITNFCADVTASWTVKVGSRSVKTNETFGVWVRDEGIGGIATTLDWFYAYKNDWKAEPWKTITKALEQETRSGTVVQYYVRSDGKLVDGNEGAHALDDEYVAVVTLKFAANGVVKETGEFVSGYDAKKGKYVTVKASGSTVAVPTNEKDGIIFVYLTPKGLPPYGHVVKWGELFE